MKTLEQKIKVMQAALAGAEIEMVESEEFPWEDVAKPDFNWSDYDYRIKPENKQVPYDFSDAESLIGRKIKGVEEVSVITTVFKDGIIRSGAILTFKYLSENFEIWNNTLNRWESCTKTVKG